MKKNKCIFLKLICLTIIGFSLSSCTINKQEEKENVRTITVSGSGTVNIKPDKVSLTFSVQTTDWVINTAINSNAATTEKVINAIAEAGISKSDIQTYDYKITQETYWSNAREYPGRYTVTNKLNVLIRNTELTGKVIDAAIKNGTTALSNYEYSASDTTTAVREARTLAVQNATDAANLLAGASGCRIYKVIDLKEEFSSQSQNAKTNVIKSNDGIPIHEGTIAVTSNVTITYSLMD